MPNRKPNPRIANIGPASCPNSPTTPPRSHRGAKSWGTSAFVPDWHNRFVSHHGCVNRTSGGPPPFSLALILPAAAQIPGPGVAHAAGVGIGDAKAPLVVNGEIRRPARALQAGRTAWIGKPATHLV